MPELPEVERARRLAERIAAGRTITCVNCAADPIVFEGISPARMKRSLTGRRIIATRRKGKHFWLELDRPPHLLMHLGMSGGLYAPDEKPLTLASSPAVEDKSWPPRFTKLRIRFDDGGELVMTDKRRFGRVRLREDPAREPPISELGFDPLLELPPPRSFSDLLRRRAAPVKAVLLDQKFAAGVGNWIADEVLYQAKIDPRRRARDLSYAEAKRVRTALKRIIEKAVAVNAEKSRFPRTWLFHHRWGKNSEARTASGERIEHISCAGRTTAWVPAAQR